MKALISCPSRSFLSNRIVYFYLKRIAFFSAYCLNVKLLSLEIILFRIGYFSRNNNIHLNECNSNCRRAFLSNSLYHSDSRLYHTISIPASKFFFLFFSVPSSIVHYVHKNMLHIHIYIYKVSIIALFLEAMI